jgi:beta-N-acetylhexosaminidase
LASEFALRANSVYPPSADSHDPSALHGALLGCFTALRALRRGAFFLFFALLALPAAAGDPAALRREEALDLARSLDDRALAAQVILAGLEGKNYLSPELRGILGRVPAGGILLFRHNLDRPKEEVRAFIAELSELILSAGSGPPPGVRIPPFMGVDHEGGLVHRFGPGVERLPAAESWWIMAEKEGREKALAALGEASRRSAGEIRGLGITFNLAPVAEILNDENRRFLDTRTFGPDGDFVEAAAAVFVKAMDEAGIASALKHFPGNTAADPHGTPGRLEAGEGELSRMVKPFAGVIRARRPSAVMVSHVVVSAWDGENNASLSGKAIGGKLRGELGFEGIILADDFSMAAVASRGLGPGEAAVAALNAGADMIMAWPSTIPEVHAAILGALGDGRLDRERLRDAAARIIAEKLRYALIEPRRTP